MNAALSNPFLTFWALGFQRLCPIVPPGAPLNEQSSLAIRMRKDATKDPRGKAPGILRDGLWQGMNFTAVESTQQHLDEWARMGAGVGIKTGQGLHLIDADTLNVECAKIIETEVRNRFGLLPARIGQFPKVGYLIRVKGDAPYMRIEFGERDDKGRLLDRVEILGEGRQFVAHGVHPKTGKPYDWPNGFSTYQSIPEVEPQALTDLLAALAPLLPSATALRIEGATHDAPEQSLLKGNPEHVRRALDAMPNTTEAFPTRETWRDVGYAIRAALPDDEALALELFQDWSAKWEDGVDLDENGALIQGNDPDYVRAEFGRMKGPYRRGASWLYEIAEQHSEGTFHKAHLYLDPPGSNERLFPLDPESVEARIAAGEDVSDEYRMMSVGDVMAQADPKYLIDRHVPERGVGILFGAPGTGKTFVTLDAALSLAYGFKSWHGDPINAAEPVSVVYLAGEGAPGYKPRIMAWLQKHEIPREEWDNGRFWLVDESIDFMKPEDVAKIVRSVRRKSNTRVALMVVDTVSTVIPGADENLQKDMTVFVRACRVLERAFSCAVWGVHHTNKAGEMRGSSVFEGGGDFIFRLDRNKGASIGHLYCHKMKDGGADAWEEHYGFTVRSIAGTADPQGRPLSSLVVDRVSSVQAAELGGLTPDKVDAVFLAIQRAAEGGEPWSMRHNVKGGSRFYQNRMVEDFKISRDAAENAMSVWLAEGRIKDGTVNKKTKLKGLFVPVGDVTQSEIEPKPRSVFD